MVTLKLVLHPDAPEMVQIMDLDGRPCALVSREVFWGHGGGRGDIHDRLSSGETVVVELRRVATDNF